MAKKLTDWFPASVSPARIGFYEVDTPQYKGNKYSFWNGQFFETCTDNLDYGLRLESEDIKSCDAKWRGLARRPSKESK